MNTKIRCPFPPEDRAVICRPRRVTHDPTRPPRAASTLQHFRRLTGALTLFAAATAGAQSAAGNSAPAERGPRNPAEIEPFVDGLMTVYLRDKHIAGGVVAIVRDTTILFSKGYGFADVDKRVPVNPVSTLFRNGSITKTFTWTAVMQLVEQGKIDPDADINTYLDFQIPATYPQPVTMRHVMTHTAGFEEDSRELFTEDSTRIRPMREWLPAHMPGRVRAPGTYSAYSNWATAVAGYIVERVSGMSYDEYLERHIFQPLGMTHATTRQPLPAALVPHMSNGYRWTNGRWEPKKFELITGAWPAGSMSVSAHDMAIWMMTHLGKGAYRGQRILAESTVVQMHTRQQGHDPRIPGFGLGFYEQTAAGPRGVGHGGDTQWFHSDMLLLPEERVGVFVSFNTNTGGEVSFKPFNDDFLAHYYPTPLPPLTPSQNDREDNKRFEGEYLMNRMSYSTFQKAFALASAVKISATDSGALVAQTPFGPTQLVRVDSMLFRSLTSHDLFAFSADENGKVTHAYLSLLPMGTLEKTSSLGSPTLHMFVLGLGVVIFVGILIAAVVRRFGGERADRARGDSLTTRGRRLMIVAALCMVAFFVAVAVLAGNLESSLMSGELGALKAALVLPVIGALALVGAAIVGVLQWLQGAGTAGMRLRHSFAVVAGLAVVWSLHTWNLLGWRF
jgi:CubicO group peptidase (beta-lactamase class C family)